MKDVSMADIIEALHAWETQTSILKDRIDLSTEREGTIGREINDAAAALSAALNLAGSTHKLRDLTAMTASALAAAQSAAQGAAELERQLLNARTANTLLVGEVADAVNALREALGPTSVPPTLPATVAAVVEMIEEAKAMIRGGL